MMRRRPIAVTLLALGVLTFAGYYLTRMGLAFKQWSFLNELPLSVSPAYLATSGALLGGTAAWLAWGLWRGEEWAAMLATRFAIGLVAAYWLERLLLKVSAASGTNWPFSAILSGLFLVWVFWTLRLKGVRTYLLGIDRSER